MKKYISLPHFLWACQWLMVLLTGYIFIDHFIGDKYISKTIKYHLIIQASVSLMILYSVNRFIQTKSASANMRKEAGRKKEIKSKRIELLIFSLMISLIFFCLYYTVPMNKYLAAGYERAIFYTCSILQFIMLIQLVSSHEGVSDDFVKSKQKYAGVGALSGLVIFYIYFILLN